MQATDGDNTPMLGLLVLVLLAAAAGCDQHGVPAPVEQQGSALASPEGQARIALPEGAAGQRSLSSGQVVIRGTWGRAAGQFGKREEASRPGPMSLAVNRAGIIHLLDQVNRRIARYSSAGQLLGTIPIASEATNDIAVSRTLAPGSDSSDVWTLALEPGPRFVVRRLSVSGLERQRILLHRAVELITGLFVAGPDATPDVWVEERHDTQLLVVAGGTVLSPDEQTLRRSGRVARWPGAGRVTALKKDATHAVVLTVDPAVGMTRLLEVETRLPLEGLHELETSASGDLYLGLLLGRESPEGGLTDARRVMLVWSTITRKATVVELAEPMATDWLRGTAVGPDGALYQMHTTEQEVTVRRWDLAPTRRGGGAS